MKKVRVVVASAAMIFLFKMKTNVSRTLHVYQKLTLSSVGTAISSCLSGKNKRFCLIQTTDLVIYMSAVTVMRDISSSHAQLDLKSRRLSSLCLRHHFHLVSLHLKHESELVSFVILVHKCIGIAHV